MEIMGTIGFWSCITFPSVFMTVIVGLPLVFLFKTSINNKKLQDHLQKCMADQCRKDKEKEELKGTIISLQKENMEMRETIKILSLEQRKPTDTRLDEMATTRLTVERHRRDSTIKKMAMVECTALQGKIKELEEELSDKEEAWKTKIASMEAKAHKRLMKSSALQCELMDKRTEIFFLHHRLMDYMDWVAELRGTKFVPLPLYPHNHKPSHERVKDSWGKLLAQGPFQILEESGSFDSELDAKMAAVNHH